YVEYTIALFCLFFFFQAEDGIRDLYVTGVQTCALPILDLLGPLGHARPAEAFLDPLAPRAPHGPAERRVLEHARERGGERVGARRRHEEPRLAVHDDLEDPADRGGDHGRLARHRFEVDEPEGFVD